MIALVVASSAFIVPQKAQAFEWHDIQFPQLDTPNIIGEKDLNLKSIQTFQVSVKSVDFTVAQNKYNSLLTINTGSKILLPQTATVSGDIVKVKGYESISKAWIAHYTYYAGLSTPENRQKMSDALWKKHGTDFNIIKPKQIASWSSTQVNEANNINNEARKNFYTLTSNQTYRVYSNARGTVRLNTDFDAGGNLLRITVDNNARVNDQLAARRDRLSQDMQALRDDTRNGIFRSLWAMIAVLWNPNSAILGTGAGIYNNADGSRTRMLRVIDQYIVDCNQILRDNGYSRVDNPFPAQ